MQEKKIVSPVVSVKAIKLNLVSLRPSKRAINSFKHNLIAKRRASRTNLARKKTVDLSLKTEK